MTNGENCNLQFQEGGPLFIRIALLETSYSFLDEKESRKKQIHSAEVGLGI